MSRFSERQAGKGNAVVDVHAAIAAREAEGDPTARSAVTPGEIDGPQMIPKVSGS